MKLKKNKDFKVLRKYHYTWYRIIYVILLFPFAAIISFICSKVFLGYLFKYKRSGLDKNGFEHNTFEQLTDDLQRKKITNYCITKEMIEEIMIGPEGKKISAAIVKNNNSNKWVVSLHGFKRNKYYGLRNISLFYKKDFNIIAFDAFAHGKTYGKKSDFGFTNSKVLNDVILYIKEKYSPSELGVYGLSMGASTALYFAQKYSSENKIDWLVADCGFSQAVQQIRFFLKKYAKLPWWLMSLGINLSFKINTKIQLKEVNMICNKDNLKELKILYIHGRVDDFIPYQNAVVMHNLKIQSETNQLSKIHLFENATHSSSFQKNIDEYTKLIYEFIE